MNAFLVLSSLGLAFYLVLLVALHRDGRRRRVNSGPVRTVQIGSVSDLGTRPFTGGGTIAARGGSSTENVLWIPVTKHRWNPASPGTIEGRAHLVHLAKPSEAKDNLQCS
jgi:hypothetical protein